MMTKITLAEAVEKFDHPVLFWTSVGTPAGATEVLGDPDWNVSIRGWEDLEGEIDSEGRWQWDGNGGPTDCRSNTVLKVTAYSSEKTRDALLGEANTEETKTVVITNDFSADAFRLRAKCDDDHTLDADMRDEQAIDASTDSWDVASRYAAMTGADVLSVDHDKDTIILTVAGGGGNHQ